MQFLQLFFFIIFAANYQMEYGSWVLMGISFFFLILQEIVRAVMEFKHKKGQNDYLFTIIQMVFVMVVMCVALASEGFGLFDLW
ncbi:DUF4181 domain-containing protein [Virgibacillus doumboii]|uniref:DUF4181 domain-containing protein n=1 Tax=Virgibacillus doumboii TaxID=2697503 RepID=UPI0013E0E009|nr:DUF4181 domain-containing protein [Virgibacillus doumboii]